MFAYTIQLEGYYHEHDRIEEILFKMLGPTHGECQLSDRSWYYSTANGEENYNPETEEEFFVDYPRCADIDIAQWNDFYDWLVPWSEEKEYPIHPSDLIGQYGADGFLYEHSHIGTWQQSGGYKTGYDYMVYTYSFQKQNDLALFLLKHGGNITVHRKKGEHDVVEARTSRKDSLVNVFSRLKNWIHKQTHKGK